LEMAGAAAIAAAPAGIVASLPPRAWQVACVLSVVALPFTIWWCGFAAIDHTGPGIEAFTALFWSNYQDALGGGRLVAREPTFILAVLGHCLFLVLASRGLLSPSAGRQADLPRTWRQWVLLLSLLPLTLSSILGMNDFYSHKAMLFGPETSSSPLGSAGEIVLEEARLAMLHSEIGYRRQRAQSSIRIKEPVLAIFIIGESARADTYGPNRIDRGADSKALAERIKAGLGAWLPTTCASSDGTHLSVPLLLTATSPQNRDEATRKPTVLGILKASGFSTAWVSNNEAGADARESGHDLYAGRGRPDADHFGDADLGKGWELDQDMLPLAQHFVGTVDRPKAMLLHTFGNHISYQDRYPPKSFPPEPPLLDSEQLENLRYTRAAEYGAQTILKVAALLDSTSAPAFLVYTSDHGENLHSDHNGVAMHLGPRTTIEDGTVPSFVLWNQAMAKTSLPARTLAELVGAGMIAHAEVANVFLALAGVRDGPVAPTLNPTTWGRISVGDSYSAVPCSALQP
jgi:glucan phosphoethanolaminetransferase (alkaline phosphatase superfamily)